MKNNFAFIIITIFITILFSCKKDGTENAFCAIPAVIPYQPYLDPVWHPNGILIGFNYQPLSGVYKNGTEPCVWYMNSIKADSVGFYIMNKNGTGLKRVTNYMLRAPSWSPDGTSIAFSLGPNIYKMPFNGNTFDTSQIIQLTNTGGNFFPSWTVNSDTIYYDSNVGSGGQGYYIWKMANNGSGKVGFPNTGREPYVVSDNLIYYLGLQAEVFSMNRDASLKTQLTFNGNINGTSSYKSSPKFYGGKIFYIQNGLWFKLQNDNNYQKLLTDCNSYSISNQGEILYPDFSFALTDKKYGTLWSMNIDGTNKKQITFNNY